MDILIVSQYFWPENFRINDLAQGLSERGHTVRVLTGLPNYPGGRLFPGYSPLRPLRERRDGIEIVRAPLMPRGKGGGVRLFANYLSFALSASVVGPFFLRRRPDAILVFEPSPVTVGIPATVLKKFFRAPVFFWVQDLWPDTLQALGAVRSPAMLRLLDRLVRGIYRSCDMILIQSRAFLEPVRRLCPQEVPVEYFPNCAEELYRPVAVADDAPERELLGDGFKLLFAGNLGAAQSLSTIVEAAALTRHLPDLKWLVAGDGRQRASLEKEIAARGLQDTVRLVGKFPPERMPAFFALADALLVTLKKDPLFAVTIPSKVQSYLACARPVLAALDGEGALVVRESGAGISCPSEDAAALAQGALELYRMTPGERDAMGRRGRAYYEKHFERNMLLDRLEKLMHRVVAPSAAACEECGSGACAETLDEVAAGAVGTEALK